MGNVFCYIQLARLLKNHCSFYGLQNPLIEKGEIDELTLPELIQLYIEEIKVFSQKAHIVLEDGL